jgi:hypothetical protein
MKLASLKVGRSTFFRRIDIMVAADPDYIDSDCGETAAIIRRLLRGKDEDEVIFTSEVLNGDLFCGLLNYGVARQVRTARIDYTCIISPEAVSHATPAVLRSVKLAAQGGARAISIAFGDLAPSVQEGRFANTFCFWHNESLQTVGGFDLRASAEEKDPRQNLYLQRSDRRGKTTFYPLCGVEEIIPLVRLIKEFGKCLAVVTSKKGAWEIPDPNKDPVAHRRHNEKMRSKLQRQAALAFQVGFDLSYLEGGLMN